ncbi:MAG: imidazole glycerol phosphate synthase subunit HisH [Christensenellales bacterium]|jgi:glutamine amidotransferase
MITVVDYGVGNLFSLTASLDYLGQKSTITGDGSVIGMADKLILPGVGAFSDAMKSLTDHGLVCVLEEAVKKGTPLLGICLGMQLLFEESWEFGFHKGLGFLPGKVCPLRDDVSDGLKIPHIGWNSLKIYDENEPMLKYTRDGEHVYYVHSFYAKGCGGCVKAASEYGVMVPGLVRRGNVWGAQFHPEKSGEVGLKMLKAFCEI